ncbi:hypothetical protein KJ815_07635 [bacterium]|nr:hypothetical protein [bacterium]
MLALTVVLFVAALICVVAILTMRSSPESPSDERAAQRQAGKQDDYDDGYSSDSVREPSVEATSSSARRDQDEPDSSSTPSVHPHTGLEIPPSALSSQSHPSPQSPDTIAVSDSVSGGGVRSALTFDDGVNVLKTKRSFKDFSRTLSQFIEIGVMEKTKSIQTGSHGAFFEGDELKDLVRYDGDVFMSRLSGKTYRLDDLRGKRGLWFRASSARTGGKR